MSKTQRFTKKPVTIEASQWFKHGDHPEVTTIPADHPIDRNCIDPSAFGWVPALGRGGHVVSPGDWIIKGVKGGFYPCKPDIFAMTYDAEAQPPAQAAADARDAQPMIPLSMLRPIAVEAIRSITGCPDLSSGDRHLTDEIEAVAIAAIATHQQGGSK